MKTFLKFFCFILLFAGSFSIFAQTSITSPGKYYLFKNYTTRDGLLINYINTMVQDRHGYIYMGSSLGLTRFDGKTFYHKAIPEIYKNSAYVYHLKTTTSGNLVSSSFMQGLFVQQNDGLFKRYLQNGYVEIGKNIATALKVCPDNSIWVGESYKLLLLKNDSLTEIYKSNGIMGMFSTIETDKDNNIWFGGSVGLGILKHSGTEYEPLFLPEFEDEDVTRIIFDKEGNLHVATTFGYYRIKWQQPYTWNENYTVEQPFKELKDEDINFLYFDKGEALWILTSTDGAYKTEENHITLHLTEENGLLSSTVGCMIQDFEGSYWFGTTNGVSMINNFDTYAIAKEGKLFDDTYGFVSDPFHRIWIHGATNLYVYQDEKLNPINLKGTPLEKTKIKALKIFEGYLWIGTPLELYRILLTKNLPDMRTLKKIADFPSSISGRSGDLIADETGMWICAENEILKYSNNKLLSVKFNHADSIRLFPSKIIRDKYGYYWCGSIHYGLYRGVISQPDKNMLLYDNIKVYKSAKVDSAFVTAGIFDMCFDKEDNLWISSSYTGAYKLTLDSSGVVSYKLYSTANGLSDNGVYRLKCDEEGRIWFLTMKGTNILKIDKNGNESFEYLEKNMGVEGVGMGLIQMNDKIFLLTTTGIYTCQNQLFKENLESIPKVLITNFLINGIANTIYSANTNKIRLTHAQNNIIIEFSAITFKNADDVMYQYKLEGTNDDWSVLSDRGFVEYASLRPGKYTFKVRAVIGEVIGEETTLSFRISPAYYQTVWFYLLIACVIFALLYTFYKYRLRQAVKVELMRARIASDLHDDIGSTLSSISMLSEMASRQDKEEILVKALSKIGENSRDVLNSMDDIIWSVNPQNDSLSNLIVRLREYAIPVCEARNINLSMNVEAAINTMKLGMGERRNTYLIVKEAINNAVKHSDCKNLTVNFVDNHHLEVSIKDDGCGFDPTSPTSRNGLANMERRAKQIGAELSIKSEPNAGTFILLKMKNHI